MAQLGFLAPTTHDNNDRPQEVAAPVVPFTRASSRYQEPFVDETATLSGSTQQLGLFSVPAYGYLSGVYIKVTAKDGAAGGATVAAAADAPWSVLSEIAFQDVNGTNNIGPFTGYDLYLANKWGAHHGEPFDPADSPAYTAIDSDGNFSFGLWIDLQFVPRNALGALPNQNQSQTYKVRVSLSGSAEVYTTAPGTLPDVRVEMTMAAWAPPAQVDASGQMQQTQPDAVGTLSMWSKYVTDVVSGENTITLPRVGNLIRGMVLVFRNTSGARSDTLIAPSIRYEWDGRVMFNRDDVLWQEQIKRAYGYAADTAVRPLVLTDDFDGRAGSELRDYYWRTTPSTRLVIRANLGAAGVLSVLTNDVAPAGNIFDTVS